MKNSLSLTQWLCLLALLFANIGCITIPNNAAANNPYDTDLSVTHLDIVLKTDFQSNSMDADVKAVVENFSQKNLTEAEFWLCPGGYNDPDFGADIKRIRLMKDDKNEDLPFTIRKIDEKWKSCIVAFSAPMRPGEKLALQFEYAMTGKPDFSSSPILKSKDGFKEVYLRGGDYLWCPTPYFDIKSHLNVCRPDWTLRMEYPSGYIAITNGELMRREEKEGLFADEWKSISLLPGTPYLYVGPYKVAKQTINGVLFEMYVPDETILKEAAERLEKYGRMYGLFTELFGDPGYPTFRIVGIAVTGVGASFGAGLMTDMNRLTDVHHIAHEMAHTWWGWMVSTTGSGSKFLSEAMAEFSARWILKVMGEEDKYENLSDENILGWKQRAFCTYFAENETNNRLSVPLIFQEGYDSGKVTARNYHWGPLAVNQIRQILGDEVFFKCLNAFLAENKGKEANIEEFVHTINTVSEKDMTSELKGLLWSTGIASYCLAGFESEKANEGYRTTVRIQNEGDYGLTCPLLLKTVGGEQRTIFKVEGKQEKPFVFSTKYRVVDVVIDPDLTTLAQYHPDQKLRLWQAMLKAMDGYGNNEAYGKSYMYYALGEFDKAVEPISDYLRGAMKREKVYNIEELLKKDDFCAGYVFMRGVFNIASDDQRQAEEDIKEAFPYMLRAMKHKDSIEAPGGYCDLGAIRHKDLDEYLALMKLIAGKELHFEKGLDDAAKKRKIEEWEQWWEKERKYQKLDLDPLKERFEGYRMEFRKTLCIAE
ncbi:MAG: M1 family aminopeptidase [Candidatus Omnitrophota bacterium]